MITKGEIYLLPFPFSDLSNTKNRPSIILTDEFELGEDFVVCAITSHFSIKHRIPLNNTDMIQGSLPLKSYIHYSKLFTINKDLLSEKIGKISKQKSGQIFAKIQKLLS